MRRAGISDALERWLRHRLEPFTATEATQGIAKAVKVAEPEVAAALREHPEVGEGLGRFYTPRILARTCSFVLRLSAEELTLGFFVPGHRFFPFTRLDREPVELTLTLLDGEVCRPLGRGLTPASWAQHTMLLATRGAPAGGADLAAKGFLRVYEVPAHLHRNPPFTGEVACRCGDPDAGVYTLDAQFERSPEARELDEALLVAALLKVVDHPPPGPVNAPRQMLQAVSACAGGLSGRPIGPLAQIFLLAPGLEVVEESGLRRFARQSRPQPAVAPKGSRLQRLVDLVTRVRRLFPARIPEMTDPVNAPVELLTWDPVHLSFGGNVYTSVAIFPATVTFDENLASVRFGCPCAQGPRYDICWHTSSLLAAAAEGLRQRGHPLAATLGADLEQPRWQRRLAHLDSVLTECEPQKPGSKAPAASSAPAPRLSWRIVQAHDALYVVPFVQRRDPSGKWSPGKRLNAARLLSAREKWVVGADDAALRTGLTTHGPCASVLRGDGLEALPALEALVGHPHVSFGETGPEPLRVERGDLGVLAARSPTGELTLLPTAGGVAAGPGVIVQLTDAGLLLIDRKGRRAVVARGSPIHMKVVAALLDARPEVPADKAEELLERLRRLEGLLPVELPPELAGQEIAADGRMRLLLTPERAGSFVAELRVRPVPNGAALFVPGEGPGSVLETRAGKGLRARRDLARETGAADETAAALGLSRHPAAGPWRWLLRGDEDALDLLAAIEEHKREDVVVEWPKKGDLVLVLERAATPKDLRIGIETRRDWFGLDGHVELDGRHVRLAAVLEALRAGRRYVALSEGRFLRLTAALRERLRDLSDLAHSERGGLEVGPATAPLVREYLAEAGTVRACAAWEEAGRRFDDAMRITPEPPSTLAADLRDYQVEGYRWLSRLAAWGLGGCLADDMGLGKTVQALAALLDRAPRGPALVVAPTSVGTNWIRETRRFCPTLRPILYRETDRLLEPDRFGAGDLVVTSYGLVLRDVEKLASVRWGTLVLDEAQFVKNHQSKTAAAVRRLDAEWRLALTGTPIENRLGELWSLFRAVCPGLFGSWERFRERFAVPIERDKDAGRRHALARLVRPFILRRTKAEVLDELPPRTEIQLLAEPTAAERAFYDQTRIALLAGLAEAKEEGEGADGRFHVLAALTTLRQLACHPRLVFPDRGLESAKLGVFLETVEELREGRHRALVFSQFTSFLAIVREALDARKLRYRYLDGSTPPVARDREVEAFQGGDGDLFLISLKAGGTGLNLTAADYVLHLDPWWNPAVEDQATDRAHRIGQTRPVTVYRIVTAGTVEEDILSLHADKRNLVAGVLEGTDRAGKLTVEELLGLIRGRGEVKAGVADAEANGGR
ncbi:MAG: DEAD/DEAH box helicase [Planctomycetes bacterium]|nr:DEAD/DEAH box helicase [Planctomycetota bacterium]